MQKTRLFLLTTVLAVLLVVFGYVLGQVTGRPWVGVLGIVGLLVTVASMMAVYLAAIVLALVVHEFGHYLAGRAVGFELRNFVAGSFGLRREGDRLVRYRVRPARLLGYVGMVPKDDRRFLSRFALFILGGPFASLLWTTAVFGAWLASGVPLVTDVPRGAPWILHLAAMAMAVVLIGTLVVLPGTLLPYRIRRMGGHPTDALWLILLMRGGEETRRLVAMATLTRLLLAGTEAEELPTTLLEEATRLRDGTARELSALTFRWAATSKREPTTARAMIARHAEVQEALGPSLIEPTRSWSRLVQASDAVFHQNDAGRAAAWLEGTVEPSDPLLVASIRMTAAGLAALRDDPDRAERLQVAEEAVEVASRKSTISFRSERERIAALRAGWPREMRLTAPHSVPLTRNV